MKLSKLEIFGFVKKVRTVLDVSRERNRYGLDF